MVTKRAHQTSTMSPTLHSLLDVWKYHMRRSDLKEIAMFKMVILLCAAACVRQRCTPVKPSHSAFQSHCLTRRPEKMADLYRG